MKHPRAIALGALLLLGHTLGVGYLELKAKRAETGGMYVSALRHEDPYATIDWDDFVYYPRAIAVAESWWPIDPWLEHQNSMPTWGVLPPLPATLFGTLLKAIGDIHVSLYLATVLSTVLIGTMLMALLQSAPFGLRWGSALLAAAVFVKMPWLAAKGQQLLPVWGLVRDTVNPFILGRPLDAFTTVEAGLFTYVFYVLFIVLWWRALVGRKVGMFVFAGAAAGLLVYVYFYHYIYAFALIAAWIVVSLARRKWDDAKLAAAGLAAGLVCALPHFTNLYLASSAFDLPGYVGRLGVEPGRFVFGNLRYLAALIIPVLLGAFYARRTEHGPHRTLMLSVLGAMILAYIGVMNLRLVLGFDVQSDHYWRQSLALPATLWVIAVVAQLGRGTSHVPRYALAAIVGVGIVFSNVSWLSGRTHPEPPSPEQSRMAERMALVVGLSQPGDVVLIPDVTTMYHASVNGRVRPFVPFVHALVSQDEIIRRYFVGQCLTGAEALRMPVRTEVPTQDETAALRSEQKYLLGTDAPVSADGLLAATRDIAADCGDTPRDPFPRLDVILAPEGREALARARILRHFEIVGEGSGGGYWAARVRPRAGLPR